MSARISNNRPRTQSIEPQPKAEATRQPAEQTQNNTLRAFDANQQRDQMVHGQVPSVGGPGTSSGAAFDQTAQFQSAYARASASDRQLLDSIRGAPNGASAFATYQGLREGEQNPARLTDAMVRDMTLGVANARGGVNTTEGLLSPTHAMHAKDALLNMPQNQFDRFSQSMQAAGTGGAQGVQPGSDAGTERQLLLKALGARSGALSGQDQLQGSQAMNQITRFAQDINGTNAAQLRQQSTLLEGDVTPGYSQAGQMGCQAATKIGMLAENDPIYARNIHTNNEKANFAVEQTLLASAGGSATRTGLTANKANLLFNNQAVNPDVGYQSTMLGPDGMRGQVNAIAGALQRGDDVPMAVKFGTGGGHAMLISAVDNGPPGDRVFTIHDSAGGGFANSKGGITRQVRERDLLDGSFLQKNFGYPPEKAAGAHVFNVQMPVAQAEMSTAQKMQLVSGQLGVVGQAEVDQGFINAARQKANQPVAEGNRARTPEPEPAPRAPSQDLDDGIRIDDDFGIDD